MVRRGFLAGRTSASNLDCQLSSPMKKKREACYPFVSLPEFYFWKTPKRKT
jgi:hypothetical protein